MSTTSPTRPTPRIDAVTQGKDDKSNWLDIGAAWPHKDGDGFNLRFDQFPLGGAEIVIRKAKPKSQPQAEGGAQ